MIQLTAIHLRWNDGHFSWGLSQKALKIELGESAFTHLSSEILIISIYNVYLISISIIYTDIICIVDIYTYNININRHHTPIYSHDTIILYYIMPPIFCWLKPNMRMHLGMILLIPHRVMWIMWLLFVFFFLMLRRLISTIAASKTIGTQWKATCACFSQTLLFVVGLLKQPFQILHLED